MSSFHDILAAALTTLQQAGPTAAVRYTHGTDTIELTAVIGRTVFEVVEASGHLVRVESRDYLVQAADLAVDDAPFVPTLSDRIRETIGAAVHVYAPCDYPPEPHYRPSDPRGQWLRIHTKLVATEEPA